CAAGDDRMRIVRQPNRGLGSARNTGLETARSEHVAFVDSDDLLPPRALERLQAVLRQTGSDFATGMVHRFDERGERPAPFLRNAFRRSRRRTHVTRFPWLV